MDLSLAAVGPGLLLALYACASAASRDVVLTLARPLQSGEAATLVVEVGALPHGHEIVVTTTSGEAIGTISPFGIRAGQAAGGYALPVPARVVNDTQLLLKLSLTGAGAPRSPTDAEVKSLSVSITPASP